MPQPVESNQFGRIVCDDQIEDELLAHIEAWYVTYLAEVERQRGWDPGSLDVPFGIIPGVMFARQPEDAFPLIVVNVERISGSPSTSGERSVSAEWSATFEVYAAGTDDDDTRRRVSAAKAALQALILQQCQKGPLVSSVTLTGGFYTDTLQSEGRTEGAAIIECSLTVRNLLSTRCGLRTPPEDPYATPAGLVPVETVVVNLGSM